MTKRQLIDKTETRAVEVIGGALGGIAVVAVIELLDNSNALDLPLWVSLFSFAVGIPLLSLLLLAALLESKYEFWVETWYMQLAAFGGPVVTFIGIAGLLWHFWIWVGLSFVVLSLFAFFVWRHYRKVIEVANATDADSSVP